MSNLAGSGIKINYSIRPAKSVERKMLCELLHYIKSSEDKQSYRYIGLGAKYFVDFLLFHNELGFDKMISIEADEENKLRYDYNKPLKCIDLVFGRTNDVLPTISWNNRERNIVWLDYDGKLDEYMFKDIEFLVNKMCPGSVFLISFNSSFYDSNDEIGKTRKRLGNYLPRNTTDVTFKSTSKRNQLYKNMLNECISNSIAKRNMFNPNEQVLYTQLVYFTYKDGAHMTTVGGIIHDEKIQSCLDFDILSSKFSFVSSCIDKEPNNITVPRLTYKEVQYLLKHMPSEGECVDVLNEVGLDEKDFKDFLKVYRYYPHFVQAYIAN